MTAADSGGPFAAGRSDGVDVLVIGGTGLLGRSLLTEAIAGGRSVAATFHSSGPDPAVPDENWTQVDLGNPTEITRLIHRLRPRAIVNAAYVQAGPDLDAVTAGAPGEIAAAAHATGARLVQLSSDIVFGNTVFGNTVFGNTVFGDTVLGDTAPLDESRSVAPMNDYGRAKATAEALVADTDPDAVIVRTSLLWGSEPGRGGPQLDLVSDPTTVFFSNQVRCPLRVDRLADACLELVDRPEITGVLHVAGSDAVNRLHFAQLLAPLVDVEPGTLTGGPDTSGTRPNRIVLDSSRARSLLRTPLPGVIADRT